MELHDIKGVGPKMLKQLNELGIYSVEDLLSYYPYRYDYFEPTILDDTYEDKRVCISAVIDATPTVQFIRKNFNKLQFRVIHNNKSMYVVIFNRAFLKSHLLLGKTISLIGKYDSRRNLFVCDDIKLNPLNKQEIIPIYHVKKGIKNNDLKKIIENALNEVVKITDYVPISFALKYNLII